jgi:hypothetical protein
VNAKTSPIQTPTRGVDAVYFCAEWPETAKARYGDGLTICAEIPTGLTVFGEFLTVR